MLCTNLHGIHARRVKILMTFCDSVCEIVVQRNIETRYPRHFINSVWLLNLDCLCCALSNRAVLYEYVLSVEQGVFVVLI